MKNILSEKTRVGTLRVEKDEQKYFKFLEKAVHSDYAFMGCVFYDHKSKKFVSTDGKRLHIVEASTVSLSKNKLFSEDRYLIYERGWLHIYGNQKEFEFIEWEIAFPNEDDYSKDSTTYWLSKKDGKGIETHLNRNAGRIIADSGYRINVGYLLDLEGFAVNFKIHKNDKDKIRPLFITEVNNKIQAVIMPMLKVPTED